MGKKKRNIVIQNEYVKDLGADMPVKKIEGTLREHLSMAAVAMVPILVLASLFTFVIEPAFRALFPELGQPEAAATVSITETVPEAPESTAAEPETYATEGIPETTAEPCQVWMKVLLNGTELQERTKYTVKPNDTIDIHAGSSEAGIAMIGYYSNLNEEPREFYDENGSITVPDHPSGTAVVLVVEAVADNDNGIDNTVTKTGWKKYYFVYE